MIVGSVVPLSEVWPVICCQNRSRLAPGPDDHPIRQLTPSLSLSLSLNSIGTRVTRVTRILDEQPYVVSADGAITKELLEKEHSM